MADLHRTHAALRKLMVATATDYSVADAGQRKTQIRDRVSRARDAADSANKNANGRIRNAPGTVNLLHIADDNVRQNHLSDTHVNFRHMNGNTKNMDAFTSSMRTLDGSLGSAQPYCSTPFMHLPRAVRRKRLKKRRALAESTPLPTALNQQTVKALVERVELLEENLLAALSMLMDYEGLSGDEREEWLDSDSDSARVYAMRVGVIDRLAHTNSPKHHIERVLEHVDADTLVASGDPPKTKEEEEERKLKEMNNNE
jgi:hypothetical protein